MESLVSSVMPLVASAPSSDADSLLDADILTDALGAELGAPVLAKPLHWWDMLAPMREGTDESPEGARNRARLQRARRIALMTHDAVGLCRRGHRLSVENVYRGKNGSQCRECRNATRRERRKAA